MNDMGEGVMKKLLAILSCLLVMAMLCSCGSDAINKIYNPDGERKKYESVGYLNSEEKETEEANIEEPIQEDEVYEEGMADPLLEGTVNTDGHLDHLVPGVFKRSSDNCITTVTLNYNSGGTYTIDIVNDITGNNSTGQTTIIDEMYSVFDDMGEAYGMGRSPGQYHETILSTSIIDVSSVLTDGCGYVYTPETGAVMMRISSLYGGGLYLATTEEGNNSVINQTGSEYGIQFMNGFFNEVTDIPYE